MPTPFPLGSPFPDGSYGTYDSVSQGIGLGPVNVTGIEEWSAGKSPYYTRGEAVSYKGLVYALNYNWDGITVGSPDSQVDADNVRVWTLLCSNYSERVEQSDMGYRIKTINLDSTFYYHKNLDNTIKRYWNYWHNVTSAHSVVFEQQIYKADNESGYGRTLLDLASTVEISPLNTAFGDNVKVFQSINFNDANGIDNKMFGFITSSCGHSNGSGPWCSPWGIFQYYGGFKYKLNYDDVGTLHYEKTITYTLTEKNWRLSPEYDPTATTPFTYTYTYLGTTYTNTVNLFMTFAAETFLGRTYTGAFRVYIDGTGRVERWELDSVSPDMRTM